MPLLTSRVLGLVNALGLFATYVLLIFLVPFLLLGMWWRTARARVAPMARVRGGAVPV